jgi:glycosyltransferase involved in cell wall biosynthesis
MARIAYLSPLPPAGTGIASYSAAVVSALQAGGFSDRHELDPVWPIGPDASRRAEEADLAIYHVGNNAHFHADIYRIAVGVPGLVVLHDLAIDDLIRGLARQGDPLGEAAIAEARALGGAVPASVSGGSDALTFPWCAHLARRARGLLVHSEFGRSYLSGIGCRTPVSVVPHPVIESEEAVTAARARGAAMRAGLAGRGAPRFDTLIGVAGDLSGAKGIEALLEALPRIRGDVHLSLVGRTASGWDVAGAVRRGPYADRVTIAADVSDDEFLAWLCASDVIVNVRHPHRGEVSGSLLRAMQAGIPVIVSGTGSYLEWPGDAVMRIAPGPPQPEELAFVLTLLASNPDLRRSLGERARAHVLTACAPASTAAAYERAVDETLSLLGDLTRRAVARWASGLAEAGATADTVRRGMGTRFADELAPLVEPGAPAG